MKKLAKLLSCLVLSIMVPFCLVGCDAGDVEEGTKTAIETTTSIIPVEFTKGTAEGIFNNALYALLSSEKVQVKVKTSTTEDGVYSEISHQQKVLIQNGKRYVYLGSVYGSLPERYVLGTYNDKQMLINLDTKKYKDVTVSDDPGSDPGGQVATVLTQIIAQMDIISTIPMFANFVVSGRYFNGVTYITIKYESSGDISNIEAEIIDGKIVSMEAFYSENAGIAGWGTYTFTYGDEVDVSEIPMSLDGYIAE